MNAARTTALSLFCGLSVLVSAQGPGENVDDLIARHLQARGGLEKIRAVTTMRATRTVPTIGATLNLVIYKKRPNLYRSEQSAAGRPPTARVLNGEGLWEVSGDKAAARPEAMAVELRELDGDIDGPLVDYRQKGHVVTWEGLGDEAGVKVHKLLVKLKSGAERRILLDAATLLERKHIGRVTLPPDRVVATTILLHDYRQVGGLYFPFAIDEERDAMGQTFAFYVDKVELNVPVDDALFRTPQGATK